MTYVAFRILPSWSVCIISIFPDNEKSDFNVTYSFTVAFRDIGHSFEI